MAGGAAGGVAAARAEVPEQGQLHPQPRRCRDADPILGHKPELGMIEIIFHPKLRVGEKRNTISW